MRCKLQVQVELQLPFQDPQLTRTLPWLPSTHFRSKVNPLTTRQRNKNMPVSSRQTALRQRKHNNVKSTTLNEQCLSSPAAACRSQKPTRYRRHRFSLPPLPPLLGRAPSTEVSLLVTVAASGVSSRHFTPRGSPERQQAAGGDVRASPGRSVIRVDGDPVTVPQEELCGSASAPQSTISLVTSRRERRSPPPELGYNNENLSYYYYDYYYYTCKYCFSKNADNLKWN